METLFLVGGYHTKLNHYGLPSEMDGVTTTVQELIAIFSVTLYDLNDIRYLKYYINLKFDLKLYISLVFF